MRAYQHEIGFDKITLGVDPTSGALLRAHFWKEAGNDLEASPLAGNLHNHRWNFASRILQGELRIDKFTLSSNGQTYRHYRYWPEHGDDLEFVGHAGLDVGGSELVREGAEYFEEANEIHHATPAPGDPAVTLMARSRSTRAYADVYTRSVRPDMSDPVIPLPLQTVRDRLEELAHLLERARPLHF